jgi:hypothetical protein
MRRLSDSDLILLGYVAGVLLVAALDYIFSSTSSTSSNSWTDQSRVLDEAHLQRLEQGDPVRIQRWHGCDLVIEGEVVIDVDEVETDR